MKSQVNGKSALGRYQNTDPHEVCNWKKGGQV